MKNNISKYAFFSILLLSSVSLYGKGVKAQFDDAAKTGNLAEIRKILGSPDLKAKLLKPESTVDTLGQALRRAASKGYLEIVQAIMGDGTLRVDYLLKYREPKDWVKKAFDKANENKYEAIKTYLQQYLK